MNLPQAGALASGQSPAEAIAALEARCSPRETAYDGAALRWRLWGRGAPLILIHGGHGSWLHWFKVIEPLAERMAVTCVDLPGFGGSDALRPEAGPPDLAAALAAGIDALFGPEPRVHLFGFSFGGVVAGHLASRLGPRTLSLGFVGSGGLGSERPDLAMCSRSRTMSPAEIESVHRHNLATLMIADPVRVDDLAVHIQHRNTLRRPALTSRLYSRTTVLSEVLRDLVCPVLAIWGDKDATVGPFLQRRIAVLKAAAPHAGVTMIPDCGHWAMYEQPPSFVEIALAHMLRDPHAVPDP